jgi:hypothetical protein
LIVVVGIARLALSLVVCPIRRRSGLSITAVIWDRSLILLDPSPHQRLRQLQAFASYLRSPELNSTGDHCSGNRSGHLHRA